MGIQGLLPFLKQIHQPVNISDFKGCTVAVDAYCWLHKGAFSCAEKLAMGEKTEQYVYYCMKYVDNLLRKGLKPILVFDGCHLKSKEDVEKTRRSRRELNRKKAAQFLREGKRSEAKECLQKCVDITPQMALNLMNVCRDRGVDCIVAPYEADAQLAYLNLSGVAQLVVTEDSDLLLFGCEKLLKKLPTYLKMNLAVTDEYVEKFICADNTFLYQLVFDPLQRKMIPLNPYAPEVDTSQLDYAGRYMPQEQAYQIALGNVDIHTHKHIAFFDPATFKPKTNEKQQYRHELSIWDPKYRIKTSGSPCKTIQANVAGDRQPPSLQGKTRTVRVDLPRRNMVASEIITEPGKITPAAEKVLMSQYKAQDEVPEDHNDTVESSQKENFVDDDAPCGDMSLEDGHSTEDDEDERTKPKKSPNKGKKRKTPSWLEETAIEEKVETRTGNTMTLLGSPEPGPSPDKRRNVFAVSPAKKMGRFNLEVHALRVKSRYFGASAADAVKTKTPTPALNSQDVTPLCEEKSEVYQTNRKTCSTSPKHRVRTMMENVATKSKSEQDEHEESSEVSQPNRKSSLASPKHRLLSMFENAPIKIQSDKNKQECITKKEPTKAGLHKYFSAKLAPTDELPSGVDTKPQASNTEPSRSSGVDLIARTPKASSKSGIKSRLSAFSWSTSGPMARHLVQRPGSNMQTGNVSGSAEARRERGEPQVNLVESLDCEEIQSDKDSEKSTDSGISDGLDCATQSPSSKGEEKSPYKAQDNLQYTESSMAQRQDHSGRKPDKHGEKDQSAESDLGDEVTELQSCSYREYIQGLGESALSTDAQSPAVAVSSEVAREGLEMTTGQDCPPTPTYSQRSSVASIDSFCLDSSQNVVDLTETDIDSQNSQTSWSSTGSRSSQHSALSKGCRISGLSRLSKTKVKPGVKRSTNQPPAGQPSIMDMMSKSKYW
ncbi:exonuclease 1 [Elysia marginata]|uniref:Exonuclease 1 n=1 Tax=Elysia marginata TaxID=1093978 RepID=A0AAV4IMH5_9GAST|nr:exonuclease 1 [Elysia marginata]